MLSVANKRAWDFGYGQHGRRSVRSGGDRHRQFAAHNQNISGRSRPLCRPAVPALLATARSILAPFSPIPRRRTARGVGSPAVAENDRTGGAVAPLSVEQVLEILADPRSVPDLRRYFTLDPVPG